MRRRYTWKWIDGRVTDQTDGWEDGTGWKKDGKIKGRKPRRKIKKKKGKRKIKTFVSGPS